MYQRDDKFIKEEEHDLNTMERNNLFQSHNESIHQTIRNTCP